MKEYKLYYEYYPFDMEHLSPKSESVSAESLTKAIEKLREKYSDKYGCKIEIFEAPARKHYNE